MEDDITANLPPESPAVDQSQARTAIAPPSGAEASGLILTPISSTILTLQDGGVRGQAGMALLQVITARLESDLADAREEIKALRNELKEVQRQYYEEHEKVGVLHERLETTMHQRWFQGLAIALGGLVGGIAGSHLNDERPGYAYAGVLLAVVLLIVGFVPMASSEDR